jgi:hypothetical protein
VSAALDAQLLSYLRNQPTPDAAALSQLPKEDRELISAVMDALVNLRATVRADPNSPYSSKVRPLVELSDRLRRADLKVPALVLCSEVRAFGQYRPVPAPALSSTMGTTPLLYYEVANFTSVQQGGAGGNGGGGGEQWTTRLSQQLTITNDRNLVVWQSPVQVITDTYRSKRTDFFVTAKLSLPVFPAGRYTLKLTLTDLNSTQLTEAVEGVESK